MLPPHLRQQNQVYLVTVAAVLLNLLIAVFNSAQDQGICESEKSRHLTRAKFIMQSAHDVEARRLPPPFNVIKVFLSVVVDTISELWWLSLRVQR